MARNPSHPRPFSADFSSRPESSSMLYSILPSAVQSRLPRLPSLRRSVSMYGLTARPKSADSSRPPSPGARTPEAGFGNAMVLSNAACEDLYFSTSGMETSEDHGETHMDGRKRTQTMSIEESSSGVGWKFANQGINLLSLAAEESSTMSQDPRFVRQLYLHAVTYLLRALPTDLTTEEQLSVRSALPSGIVEPLRLETHPAYTSKSNFSGSSNPPSVLHRALASSIVQLFILFQFLLPYLKYLLRAAYQYDRTHKISERVLSGSIETVDTLGKTGLGISAAVLGMGDGKVGQMMADLASWIVEGVTGEIHEGVGEGMAMIGATRRQAPEVTVR